MRCRAQHCRAAGLYWLGQQWCSRCSIGNASAAPRGTWAVRPDHSWCSAQTGPAYACGTGQAGEGVWGCLPCGVQTSQRWEVVGRLMRSHPIQTGCLPPQAPHPEALRRVRRQLQWAAVRGRHLSDDSDWMVPLERLLPGVHLQPRAGGGGWKVFVEGTTGARRSVQWG